MIKPVVWTIAGSDSCAGAGIQSDLLTMHHLGVRACSIITAVTAQNLHQITASYFLPATIINQQITATPEPCAVKIGMLGNVEIIQVIQQFLHEFSGQVVMDPLLHASTGQALFAGHAEEYKAALKSLFPHVTILTPNRREAEMLLARTIENRADMEAAAHDLLAMGVKHVVLKGGHFHGAFAHDYWTDGVESCWLSSPRIEADCHGTGCVLSSAITACLALGYSMKDALVIAKMVINRGMRAAEKSCSHYFSHQTGWTEEQGDLPYVSNQPLYSLPLLFPQHDQQNIGLYPVIDSVQWIEQLLPLGVTHIQLRIKNKFGAELEREVEQAIKLARQHQKNLFINDYWQLAIKYGAYGVHLGQEDLQTADIAAIHAAGLRLGISTHCYEEVASNNMH